MSKSQRLGVVAIALFAGLVGGLLSGFLLQGGNDAHAASVPRADPGYRISSSDKAAYIVDSRGYVYRVLSSDGRVEKLGECK